MEHNLYAYCLNNPINLKDEDRELPKWAIKALIGVAVIAAGALKGAALGTISGGTIGAATGAIGHRIKTGSWKGAGKAALESGASVFLSGAIAGAITGGIGGYAKYKVFGIKKVGKLAFTASPRTTYMKTLHNITQKDANPQALTCRTSILFFT